MAKKFRELTADWSPDRIAAVEARTQELLRELPLVELRQARDFTQAELAEVLGTTQASVSKLERRSDIYLSTLRRLVEAMGGELEITARFPDGDIRLGHLRVPDPAESSVQV